MSPEDDVRQTAEAMSMSSPTARMIGITGCPNGTGM